MKDIQVQPSNNPTVATGFSPDYVKSFDSVEAFMKDAKHNGILSDEPEQDTMLKAAWNKANPSAKVEEVKPAVKPSKN